MATSVPITPTFVDLQGFIVRQKFVVKEVAVLKNGKELFHYIFRPPMDWGLLTRKEKRQVSWLMTNHHHLSWKSGDVEYQLARTKIRQAIEERDVDTPPPVIYVKGGQKKEWLEHLLRGNNDATISTLDADYDDVEKLSDMMPDGRFYNCGRHDRNCAMENACKLHAWWRERDDRVSRL